MMKLSHFALAAVAFVSTVSLARAQNVPAATASALQVGGEVTVTNSDYAVKDIKGASLYATYDFTQHIGVELDLRDITFSTPDDLGERAYLIGPRYVYRFHNIFEPYARLTFGLGQTVAQESYVSREHGVPGTYGAYAFGGGLDILLPHHLTVRPIDYELQKWSFPPNGLSPTALSFGLAYRIY